MLSLFKKPKAASGRAGVCVTDEGVALAVVEPGRTGRPLLRHCEFRVCPREGVAACVDQILRESGSGRTAMSAVLSSSGYQLVLVEAPDVLPAELKAVFGLDLTAELWATRTPLFEALLGLAGSVLEENQEVTLAHVQAAPDGDRARA